MQPIKINLKKGMLVPRKKQYPLKKEALEGIQPVLQVFKIRINLAISVTLQTPILPVKKPYSDEYQSVQDLRAIADIVQDIHPTVPPLTMVPGDSKWFSVLDLKDAFFCILINEQAQQLFAFEWQNPETKATRQYCWTVLPQGFKNSQLYSGNC